MDRDSSTKIAAICDAIRTGNWNREQLTVEEFSAINVAKVEHDLKMRQDIIKAIKDGKIRIYQGLING